LIEGFKRSFADAEVACSPTEKQPTSPLPKQEVTCSPTEGQPTMPSPEQAVEEVPEYNTNQGCGTHELCNRLFHEQEYLHGSNAKLLMQSAAVDCEVLHSMMTTRRELACATATALAEKALKQAGTLPGAIFNILDKTGVRRGTAKSPAAQQKCLKEIEAALEKPGPLTLAVLTFPFRDMHPFKNVGQLPDAGEVEALVRLWTIGKAISCLGLQCKVIALRDGVRYPSGWHYSLEGKQTYGDSMRDIIEALALGDCLEVRDVDDRTENETPAAYEARMQGHREAYESELTGLLAMFDRSRSSLLSAKGGDEFSKHFLEIARGEEMLPMFYAMLHGLPPCATPHASEFQGVPERRELMARILGVFTPSAVEAKESARQDLLWQSLANACKYVAAYKSRSAANNPLGLDDVFAAAPNALRLSIHNKSKENGQQFPIKVGYNSHRTPWHGSAELRFSGHEKAFVFDVKMAAEMWNTHVAVLPSASTSVDLATKSTCAVAWERYCARLRNANQPFFFADSSTLPENWSESEVLALLLKRVVQTSAKKTRRLRNIQSVSAGGA